MGRQIANLNDANWAFQQYKFGDNLDKLLALARQCKSVYNAHVHAGTASAPTSSISAAAVGTGYSLHHFRQDIHPAFSPRGAQVYVDAVALMNDFQTKFNAHTHAAIAGVPGSSISLTLAPSLSPYEVEQLNRMPPGHPQVGERLRDILVLAYELKTDFNAHTHTPSMTSTTDQPIAATDPATLD